jgi:hypothetical protein
MKGKVLRSFALLVPLLGAGCLIAPVVPPPGIVFTNNKAPLDLDYQKTDVGSKVGKASTKSILGLFAWGDASTLAAMRDGGITEVKHADYEYLNVIGIYQAFTVVVRGD